MAITKIEKVAGRGVYVPGSDIDTDRIIPARFMKCVTFDGLGEYLFYDVRKNEDGSDKRHPLNDSRFAGASLLLSGANFGCGSSREHAPQAIYRYGFRAIIAESFAEIFFGNCTTLGIPCVAAAAEDIAQLAAAIENDPSLEVSVDLVKMQVFYSEKHFPVQMPQTAHEALVQGRWDPISELLEGEELVAEKVDQMPYAG